MEKHNERSPTGAFKSAMLCLDRIERKVDEAIARRKSGVPKTPRPPEPGPDAETMTADVDGNESSVH